MTCPRCANHKSRVHGTRSGMVTKRFRICASCGYAFKTREVVEVNPLDAEYVEYLADIGEMLPTDTKVQRGLWDD